MSTASDRAVAPEDLPPPGNPYYYGSRRVRRTRPDGTESSELVPLTRQDVLHPQEGDYIVKSSLHEELRDYLASVFRARLADVAGALVLSNTGVYWDKPDLAHHAPDVAVILGVKETRPEWPSFDVAEQGTRPRLIIELVSPHVRNNDLVDKLRDYHTAEVPVYVIADRRRLGGDWTLLGFQYTPAGYLPMAADTSGRLWLADVGVWLAAEGQMLVCYDGRTGEAIGDYLTVSRQRAEEKARADAEAARAAAEAARAAAEAARAEAEAQARATAEARLRELEAELARLRGPKAD